MTTDEAIDSHQFWRSACAIIGVSTILRITVIFLGPLQLYPDEAQYWVWSRHLDFGYFSKPPMIAWLIRATTAIGGQGEAWVRLSSPLLHGGAAFALAATSCRFYGRRAGLAAALIYTLIPGVQLSSTIASTDAPLLFLLSLAIWGYAVFSTTESARTRRWAALSMGAALGLGFLTKYAALYIAGGIALHALVSRDARRRWTPDVLALYVGAGVLLAAPNLLWNLAHHFQTVAHTAENADLGDEKGRLQSFFGARGPFGFLLGQFGVFGPAAFGVAAVAAWRAIRGRGPAPDVLLVCLAAPALVLVLLESVAARANANWAGAAYAPATVLAAGAFERWRARRLYTYGVLGLQGFAALAFLAAVMAPALADAVGAGNAFKRARGWREDATAVIAAARANSAPQPLSAVAVDDRFLFNALSYYARDGRGRPAGALPAPLKMWVRLAHPANQAETETPLTPALGGRVLGVSPPSLYLDAFRYDFTRVRMLSPYLTSLDRRHTRKLDLFIGEDFHPRPRDPLTGVPISP